MGFKDIFDKNFDEIDFFDDENENDFNADDNDCEFLNIDNVGFLNDMGFIDL